MSEGVEEEGTKNHENNFTSRENGQVSGYKYETSTEVIITFFRAFSPTMTVTFTPSSSISPIWYYDLNFFISKYEYISFTS